MNLAAAALEKSNQNLITLKVPITTIVVCLNVSEAFLTVDPDQTAPVGEQQSNLGPHCPYTYIEPFTLKAPITAAADDKF